MIKAKLNFRPLMSPAEIAIIRHLLLSMEEPVQVLEWGSGNSTLYFTSLMQQFDREYAWTSLESDPVWHSSVVSRAMESDLRNIDVRLVDFNGINPKTNRLPDTIRDEYVGEISKIRHKVDIAIIDGRFRRRCTATARQLQKEGRVGLICLMDTNKTYRLIDEMDSLSGEAIETGINPYRWKFKPMSMWIGCQSPDALAATMAEIKRNVDIPELAKEAEDIHRRWNSRLGRARRKFARVKARVFNFFSPTQRRAK